MLLLLHGKQMCTNISVTILQEAYSKYLGHLFFQVT